MHTNANHMVLLICPIVMGDDMVLIAGGGGHINTMSKALGRTIEVGF